MMMATKLPRTTLLVGIACSLAVHTSAFSISTSFHRSGARWQQHRRKYPIGRALQYSDRDQQYLKNDADDDDDPSNNRRERNAVLQSRIEELKLHGLEQELQRPPNPHLSPLDFIKVFLKSLWTCDDPFPDDGFRVLLRCATHAWRQQLYASVGAPPSADAEVVASALSEAMQRPNNQFRILVTTADDDESCYRPSFPTDPVDYMDGTCWVECQLRCRETDKLLVTTGWQLEQENGCWMIDRIDWQDFRDAFRPGIGREEWIRICG